VRIQHRIIGRLDPDFPAAFTDTSILGGLKFAVTELRPEFAIAGAVTRRRFHEHAVMLSADFVERVTQRGQKVFVGRNDRAIELEFDDCLRAANGSRLRLRRLT
jgi:hypothetical protein